MVADTAGGNSGGGSCTRPEPGSVAVRVPAVPVESLWRSKAVGTGDLLKLYFKGPNYRFGALAGSGMLWDARRMVREWHPADNNPATVERACQKLCAVWGQTHEVRLRHPFHWGKEHFVDTSRTTP